MTDSGPWLVVGLGNPGPAYAGNRHNVGAMVVDELSRRAGSALRTHKAGGSVSALLRFFSVPPERLVVVHDELDLDAGTIRLKRGGGEGGHNGLRSVSSSLGTKDYHRVRVGIGRPPGRMDPADFVLRDFSPTERKELPFVVDEAADAVESLVTLGLLDAQQRVHAPR